MGLSLSPCLPRYGGRGYPKKKGEKERLEWVENHFLLILVRFFFLILVIGKAFEAFFEVHAASFGSTSSESAGYS